MTATAVRSATGWTAPMRRSTKMCCISLCSQPVHCKTNKIPFLKCHRPGYPGILRKNESILSFPAIWRHQLTRWSLKMPLWSWWRILGVKHVNILVCGTSPQNGLYTGLIPSFVKAGTQWPLSLCWRITFNCSCYNIWNCTNSPCSSCRTIHSGQWLSLQQATKHCSGKSVMYAARIRNTQQVYLSVQVT